MGDYFYSRIKARGFVTPLDRYMDKIGAASLLPADEERELARLAQAGDRAARARLIRGNMRLAFWIGARYAGSVMPLEDIMSEAVVGLIRAVDKFDPARGLRFSSMATFWIRQNVGRAVAEKARVIRLSGHVTDQLTGLHLATRRATERLGVAATEADIAAEMGVTPAKVAELKWLRESDALSLDWVVAANERAVRGTDVLLMDCLAAPGFDEALDDRLTLQWVWGLVDQLPPQQAQAMRLCHGEDATGEYKAVAEVMGVSAERVRQLHKAGLETLRHVAAGEVRCKCRRWTVRGQCDRCAGVAPPVARGRHMKIPAYLADLEPGAVVEAQPLAAATGSTRENACRWLLKLTEAGAMRRVSGIFSTSTRSGKRQPYEVVDPEQIRQMARVSA